MGANAVIGIDLDYETVGSSYANGTTAAGTAVKNSLVIIKNSIVYNFDKVISRKVLLVLNLMPVKRFSEQKMCFHVGC